MHAQTSTLIGCLDTGKLFRGLLDRKHALLGSATPWSIVELRLDSDEISNLFRWLDQTSAQALREARKSWSCRLDPSTSYTNDVVCGLILHALYAEHVRRDGTEGGYWNSVARLPWPTATRYGWFTENGQPSALHRKVLEATAQTLRLRNAFGIEGTFQWFATGYLQFGFTRKGFLARLPEWLASDHYITNAIEGLLHDEVLRSPSFATLWETLRSYRHGNLAESVARERLRASPWVPDEWIDELLKGSRKKLHLGTAVHEEDEDDFGNRFLSSPVLEISQDGTPSFRSRIEGLADLILDAECYNLTVNGERLARLVRQSDGGYATGGADSFVFPWTSQLLTAQLEDAVDGSIVAGQVLVCWRPEEGVQVFKQDGTRYPDPLNVRNQKKQPLRLMFPTSLELSGASVLEDWSCPKDRWHLALIDPNQPAELLHQGQVFWRLEEALASQPQPEGITEAVRVDCSEPDRRTRRSIIQVSLPDEIEIRWTRCELKDVELPPNGGSFEYKIQPENYERGLLIHMGLSVQGRAFRIQKRVRIPFTGVLWFIHGDYKFGDRKVVSSREVASARLEIRPLDPNPDEDRDFALLEGSRLVRRLPKRPISPGSTLGLGSPLVVHRGPFNDGNMPFEVADAVVDGGLVHQVKINPEVITIFPADGLRFREDLVWLAWVHSQEAGARLERITPEESVLESGKAVWTAPNQFAEEGISAIGAFLEGRRVGSWWNMRSWTRILNHFEDEGEIANQIVRLFRCPLLYKPSIKWLRFHFQRHKASCLVTWLKTEASIKLPELDLILHDPAEPSLEWKRAIGEFWDRSGAELAVADAGELLEALEEDFSTQDPEPGFLSWILGLTDVSPLLATDCAIVWLRKFAIEAYGKPQAIQMLQSLVKALEPHEDQVEDFCRNVVRADPHFVQTQINSFAENWPHLPPITKRNLRLLFSHDVARRMATRARLIRLTNSHNAAT